MLPGPTPLPPEVLQAMARPMINHRSEAFSELYFEVEAGVKWLCQTNYETVMLAGSGTTGMEAALCNLFSPAERVLAITQGSFSERFAQMAQIFGLKTDLLAYDWGQPASPQELAQRLSGQSYKAVLLVHNETSTGVLNPLAELAAVCKQAGVLSIVDAISSLSSTPLPIDDWGLDVVISASQKGYYAPPGLSMLALSPAAWQAVESARLPRFSLDLLLARDYARKGQTPFTPPFSVLYALQAGFKLLRAEGREQIQARHLRLTRAIRAGLEALGLKLLMPDEQYASRVVTPAYPPEGIAADELRQLLLEQYQISLGAGLRKMSGQVFRIGHLGYQDLVSVLGLLQCLELGLRQLGYQPPTEVAEAIHEALLDAA